MKIKDLLIPLLLAIITTWFIQYLFVPKKQSTDAGEFNAGAEFIPAATQQMAQPLQLEVDFYDAKPTREQQTTRVETPHSIWEFSNDGAIVQSLSYKRI